MRRGRYLPPVLLAASLHAAAVAQPVGWPADMVGPRGIEAGQGREMRAEFMRQSIPCLGGIASPGPGAERIMTRLRVRLRPDGSLVERPAMIAQSGVDDGNRAFAARLGEAAAEAIDRCAPYRLPPALYAGGWNEIIINHRLPG